LLYLADMTEFASRWRPLLRWLIGFVCALMATWLAGLVLLESTTAGAGLAVLLVGTCAAAGLSFYVVTGAKIGAVFAGLVIPLALFALVALAFSADRSHTYPKGPVESVEPLTAFSDFPLYWLGPTYQGLELTEIHTQVEEFDVPAHTVMYLTYGYGVCDDRGFESRCTNTPILLIEEPACSVARINYIGQGEPHIYVWTSKVSIRAEGTAPPPVQVLLRDLSLVNSAQFPDATVVDSKTYDAQFRSLCDPPTTASPTPAGPPRRP
jgi:hypothetical protein